jgi:hypothetical protein
MFKEDKKKIQKEKDQLLPEKIRFKEVVTKSFHSVLGLAQEEEESARLWK